MIQAVFFWSTDLSRWETNVAPRRRLTLISLSILRSISVLIPCCGSDDADRFCEWCLEEFDYDGQTIFMAPASGFYTSPGMGRDEVRIAYVLKKEELAKALRVLRAALEAYPGRKN